MTCLLSLNSSVHHAGDSLSSNKAHAMISSRFANSLLGVVFTLMSCGPPPDFITPRQVSWFESERPGWVSPELASSMEELFLTHLSQVPGFEDREELESCLQGVEVHLKGTSFFFCFDSPQEKCDGFAWQRRGQVWIITNWCPEQTLLFHEWLHVMDWCIRGREDYWHEDPELWGRGKVGTLYYGVCPEVCRKNPGTC